MIFQRILVLSDHQQAIKNVLYLPLQIVLLALVLRYLLPVLYQQGLTPKQLNGNRIFSRRG